MWLMMNIEMFSASESVVENLCTIVHTLPIREPQGHHFVSPNKGEKRELWGKLVTVSSHAKSVRSRALRGDSHFYNFIAYFLFCFHHRDTRHFGSVLANFDQVSFLSDSRLNSISHRQSPRALSGGYCSSCLFSRSSVCRFVRQPGRLLPSRK